MIESNKNTTVHGLVCHGHVDMAYINFSSLLKYSVQPIKLVIHDDGSLTEQDKAKLICLQGAEVLSRPEADELMNPLLKKYPNCYKIRYEHPMFLKLLDIALLSSDDFGYCDTDVLFFRPFQGLFQWPDAKTSAIFMQDYIEAYSVFPWHLIGTKKLSLPSKVNAGLMFVRKSAYDLDFVEWFLGQRTFRSKPIHKMEQTCWAALGYRIGCRLWNPDQIVLMRTDTTLTEGMVAGHFVKEVRHCLKNFLLIDDTNIRTSQPILVDTIPAGDCDILNLAENHIKRQSNRIASYRKKILSLIKQKLQKF
jgi:hypothetical protein